MRAVIPVSAGELIDRITILEIKAERIPDAKSVAIVRRELRALRRIRTSMPRLASGALRKLEARLRAVNLVLWDLEDRLRAMEAKKSFGNSFVALARRVYRTNDRRAKIKRAIDELVGSEFREQKWFSKPVTDVALKTRRARSTPSPRRRARK